MKKRLLVAALIAGLVAALAIGFTLNRPARLRAENSLAIESAQLNREAFWTGFTNLAAAGRLTARAADLDARQFQLQHRREFAEGLAGGVGNLAATLFILFLIAGLVWPPTPTPTPTHTHPHTHPHLHPRPLKFEQE